MQRRKKEAELSLASILVGHDLRSVQRSAEPRCHRPSRLVLLLGSAAARSDSVGPTLVRPHYYLLYLISVTATS